MKEELRDIREVLHTTLDRLIDRPIEEEMSNAGGSGAVIIQEDYIYHISKSMVMGSDALDYLDAYANSAVAHLADFMEFMELQQYCTVSKEDLENKDSTLYTMVSVAIEAALEKIEHRKKFN